MKKILVVLFFTSSSLFNYCEGQFNTYHPFPSSNARWGEEFEGYNNAWYSQYYNYYLRGDTVVNGKTYFKLNQSGGYEFGGPPYSILWQSYDYLVCLLREDTAAKRIYASFKPNLGTKDTLLYDFNLNIGDTLPPTYNNNMGFKNYVKAIDSLLIGTHYRKQFIITNVVDSLYWEDSIIEGIGSTQGLLTPILMQFGEAETWLLCFKENDITVYPSLNDSCQDFILNIPNIIKAETNFTIYPNPGNGVFTLQSSVVSGKLSVEVYNVLGEKVYSHYQITKSSNYQIDLSSQPNGIYLYRVLTEDGSLIGEGKLFIQK